MVATRHNPESSSVSDKEIRRIIHEEVAANIMEAIPEMFRSIKTTLIDKFDECYATGTEVVAVAATAAVATSRPHRGDSFLF